MKDWERALIKEREKAEREKARFRTSLVHYLGAVVVPSLVMVGGAALAVWLGWFGHDTAYGLVAAFALLIALEAKYNARRR